MHYSISFTSPQKQLISVQISFDQIINESYTDFCIPAWRPGRYELQQYAKNIIHFRVFDESNQSLDWIKIDRNTWRINSKDAPKFTVVYLYYASQMDAGGSWLDETQLYLNPINCLMYVKSLQNEVHTLALQLPDNYAIASGLELNNEGFLEANNYLHLADSPIFASKSIAQHCFVVENIPFQVSIVGHCEAIWSKIEADFKRFIFTQMEVFGDFPEKNYHFLVQILPYPHYHGVEHRNSTVITLGPDTNFDSEIFYDQLIGICSHELFHTWNICKIRPIELMPYDLAKESYFTTGFVAEGITTYYGDLMLLRSGIWDFDKFFGQFSENLNSHFSNPAKNNVSLVESSIDLWVDGYAKSHPLRKVSIYDKGALVAFVLDVEIRKATANQASLDNVMKKMWQKFGKTAIGYSLNDFVEIASQIAEIDLSHYFKDYILGTTSLERTLAKQLDYLGLVLHIQHPEDILAQKFGLKTQLQNGKRYVTALDIGSPADKFLSLGDEILTINGTNDEAKWQKLYDKQMLPIMLNRSGKELAKNLIADQGNYFPIYSIRKNQQLKENQLNNFDIWAGTKLR